MSQQLSPEGSEIRPTLDGLSYDPGLFQINQIPERGKPAQLYRIVQYLNQSGSKSKDDIEDNLDGLNGQYVTDNLKNGENLGFIDRNEDGVVLTDQGYELAFAVDVEETIVEDDEDGDGEIEYDVQESEDSQKLFREGISNFDSYTELLKGIYSENGDLSGSDLENTVILELLRTKFGVREMGEAVVKRKISHLFHNLESAGYGEYKPASGGYPTRFGFNENDSLETILQDILPGSSHPPEEENEDTHESGEADNMSSNGNQENDKSTSIQMNNEGSSQEIVDDVSELADEKIDETSSDIKSEKTTNIKISIDLDLSEMDTAELEAKLNLLREIIK